MQTTRRFRLLNLWLTLIVLVSMLLAGCGGGGSEPPPAPAATEAPAEAPAAAPVVTEAAAEAPVRGAAPAQTEAPEVTEQPASGEPAEQKNSEEEPYTYVDPTGEFEVLNWGGTVESTDVQTTFRRDDDVVLISYEETDLPLSSDIVVDTAENWVNWAFETDNIQWGQPMMGKFSGGRTGYWVPFTTPPNADGYQKGLVFLIKQDNRSWAILFYGTDAAYGGADTAAEEGEWWTLLSSFKPAGWDELGAGGNNPN